MIFMISCFSPMFFGNLKVLVKKASKKSTSLSVKKSFSGSFTLISKKIRFHNQLCLDVTQGK